MAESEVPVPTVDEVDLATKLIGGRHFQEVSIENFVVQTTAFVSDAAEADYTEGDVLGSPAYLGRWPSSVFELIGVNFFSVDVSVPATFDVILTALASTPDEDPPTPAPTVGDDGDPLALDSSILSQAGFLLAADREEFPYSPGPGLKRATNIGETLVLATPASPPDDATLVDVYATLVATEDTPSADFSAGLGAAITLRQIPTHFLDVSYAP